MFIILIPSCLLQVLFNKETEQILGVHIIGLHAADLIQECANAMVAGSTVRQLAMMVSALDVYAITIFASLICALAIFCLPKCTFSVANSSPCSADTHAPHAERSAGRRLQGRSGHGGALSFTGAVEQSAV